VILINHLKKAYKNLRLFIHGMNNFLGTYCIRFSSLLFKNNKLILHKIKINVESKNCQTLCIGNLPTTTSKMTKIVAE